MLVQCHFDLTQNIAMRARVLAAGQEFARVPPVDHVSGNRRRRNRHARAQVTAVAEARETELPVSRQRFLQVIEQRPQLVRGQVRVAQRMQPQMIEARLEEHGIGRRDPDRRPVARLAPHPQRPQPFLRVRQVQHVEDARQQLPRMFFAGQVGLRKPGAERWIGDPTAAGRGQNDDGGRFVI